MPCNLGQLELSAHAAAAIEAAGGVPLPFNTIAVSDNQSQGTPGMRASLISREVIADSIELMVHAHDFDAVVCIVGCDKTVPAALMALARVDKPAVVLYSGPMRAGRRGEHASRSRTCGRPSGRSSAAPSRARSWTGSSATPAPVPAPAPATSRPTPWPIALECLGIAVVGDGLIPADAIDEKARGRRARRPARGGARGGRPDGAHLPRSARAAQRDGGRHRHRRLEQRVLHLLAIAYEAGVHAHPRRAHGGRGRTPAIASLAPRDAGSPRICTRAGGTAAVIAELIRAGLLDGEAPAVQGGTLADATAAAAGARRRGRLHGRAAVQAERAAVLACAATSPPRAAS